MVEHETVEDVNVLSFSDVQLLDEYSYESVQSKMDDIMQQEESTKIVIDMGSIRLVSTSVWGKLFVISQKSKKEARRLALCGLGNMLRDAVRMLKLDRYLEIYENREEAIKAFNSPPPE